MICYRNILSCFKDIPVFGGKAMQKLSTITMALLTIPALALAEPAIEQAKVAVSSDVNTKASAVIVEEKGKSLLPEAVAEAGKAVTVKTETVVKEPHGEFVNYVDFTSASLTDFIAAERCLLRAKRSEDMAERSVQLAEGVDKINNALLANPQNPDYLLLASQLYRSKGGASYAKSYFQRCEAALSQRLGQHPASINDNLDYAIACYAGDKRYSEEYDAYRQIGREYAEKVLKLYATLEPQAQKKANALYALALAKLILSDKEACKELLMEADNAAVGLKLQAVAGDGDVQSLDQIYCATVMENTWLWKVSPDAVDKEFLLLFMRISERYW
jgi:hypothetical protein